MYSRRQFLDTALWASPALPALAKASPGRPAPADSSKKIRLGVVGGGFGTSFQFHEHPNCEVAAVTDLRTDRRARLRDTYHCDAVYDSMDEMLRRAKLDAVGIYSGGPDHCRHAVECMNRGLHVISAVPACFSIEEAEQLKTTKEKTGVHYMMAETSYYRQPTIYARNLHREGGFGELFYSEVEYYHDRGDLDRLLTNKQTRLYEPDGSRSWRWGLPPMYYPTHCLGFLVGVTGERITRVSCLGWGTDHPILNDNRYGNSHWNESALMQTDRGHMTRCNVFWLVSGHDERAQWYGEKGSLHMRTHGLNPDTWVERSLVLDKAPTAEALTIPNYWETDMLPPPMRHASGHGGSHTFLSAEFINALVEDREPVIDIYEALAMTVPGIVAHRSAKRNGEQLPVPQFDREGG